MSIDTIILFAGIVFLIAIIPGPNALLILFTALTKSRLQAFSNIAGVSLGFIVHAFISAQGISLLLSQSVWAFMLLKWLGVAYLIWLGISNIRAGIKLSTLKLAAEPKADLAGEKVAKSVAVNTRLSKDSRAMGKDFMKGFLTNMLNPKIVMFYLSIFPQFISQQSVLADSMILGLTQAIVVSSWFLVVIMMAEKFKSLLTNVRNARWMNYVSGSIFLGFGAKLAITKL
ncbi:LysE family translocator [Shewanella sp.]|uniref:LysE family translocator n=1 Tax=Shewanella sp. TaxID=50422 RepID=UPI001EBDE6CC|nr:LysE family translocator [Shewanella sp.]NRB22908.1 LysE family translocator [Shewanella sp.]